MDHTADRSWWRATSRALIVCGVALAAYVLSAVPMAILLHDVFGLSWEVWETLYYPLVWLSENNSVVGAIFDYFDGLFGW